MKSSQSYIMETPDMKISEPNWWGFSILPIWNNRHRDLPYTMRPFNDQDAVNSWRAVGFSQERFQGDLYDMRNIEPEWMSKVLEQFTWQKLAWSLYRMMPGHLLPLHRDLYTKYIEIFQIANPNNIRRAIIFLEDWSSGHYFEIDDTPILKWKAGDGVAWNYDTPHIAGNVGFEARYTLQITGVQE